MVSPQTLSVLLTSHISFSAPLAMAAEPFPMTRPGGITSIFRPRFEPPQHSPPLYTLHASLLI
jgi:hypothetical protein